MRGESAREIREARNGDILEARSIGEVVIAMPK